MFSRPCLAAVGQIVATIVVTIVVTIMVAFVVAFLVPFVVVAIVAIVVPFVVPFVVEFVVAATEIRVHRNVIPWCSKSPARELPAAGTGQAAATRRQSPAPEHLPST